MGMTMTSPHPHPTTLTARCPEDVLALVPVVLGFVPTDSVVMLTFGAAQSFHARADLPDGPDEAPEVLAALLAPARRHRVRRVVFVVYTDDAAAARNLARLLRREFGAAGIDVAEVLRADGARWFPLTPTTRGVPEWGVPYDIGSHPFLAQAVLQGRVTHTSREELAASIEVDLERAERVAELARALSGAGHDVDSPPDADVLGEGEWVHTLVGRHVADGTVASDEETARLLRAIQVPQVRDAAWSLQSRSTADSHVVFWTDVCRRTPADLLAPPAALLGWAAWQAGHGALAWCAADLAAECDPAYTLVHLLARALEHAVPPSAWVSGWDWKEEAGSRRPPEP